MNPIRLKHDKTLITGKPGVGKTTIIQKVIERMPSDKITGFFTVEIRTKGSRVGFELVGLNGKRRILAHTSIQSRQCVGKYGVDTAGFEDFLKELDLLNPDVNMIVIDEIGKMELFSNRFRSIVRQVMNSDKQALATIAQKDEGFIRGVKQMPGIHLLEVTLENRDSVADMLMEMQV